MSFGDLKALMSDINEKSALESRIKSIDHQIELLTTLRNQSLEKLQRLQVPAVPTLVNHVPQTDANKTKLFLSYFHGREDVYAKLWMNNRSGKRGYSPVCKNEWVRTLCRKPAIKCSECPNQQFLSLDEIAALQHLDGRQVIGVYPMLRMSIVIFLR